MAGPLGHEGRRCGDQPMAPAQSGRLLRRATGVGLEGNGHGVRGGGFELGRVGRGEHRSQLVLTRGQGGDRSDGDAAEDRDGAAEVGGAVFELNRSDRVSRSHGRGGNRDPPQPQG